jgi:hypothetical protein
MVQKLAFALGIDPTDLFSKELDPAVTMKTYQKLALEVMGAMIGELIGGKIRKLDKEIRKIGDFEAEKTKNPDEEAGEVNTEDKETSKKD